ncbi:MAG: hypothetical protein AUI15_22160 [Actinobacteria bacterium 13_2_20CM_2_66_6]|nr:MAG: hypothetical protein AUI15_22160 [Actinobacteria bacterium 13_2_20CM_2_66_6]
MRVLERNNCSAPKTSTATTSTTRPSAETERPLVTCQLPVVTAPALPPSERTSGENASWRRFWITIDSPNVARRGVRMPDLRLRSSTVSCST